MFKKHLVFAGLLSAAVGVPYSASEWRGVYNWLQGSNQPTANGSVEQQLDQLTSQANDTVRNTAQNVERELNNYTNSRNKTPVWTVSESNRSNSSSETSNSTTNRTSSTSQPSIPAQDLGIVPFHEAISLEVSEQYVLHRWSRVNTGLIDNTERGFRVSLVTGSNHDDPAGVLTYYFDVNHRCTRLTFSGTVGEPQKMVWYLVQYFGFEAQKSPEPGVHLYQVRKGKNYSELWIRPAQVVRTTNPHLRYEVELKLFRP
jgi:hypothetical protein